MIQRPSCVTRVDKSHSIHNEISGVIKNINALMTDDVEEVMELEGDVWLITRTGRIGLQEGELFLLAGYTIEPVELPFETENYQLWFLDERAFTDLIPD